MYRKDGNENTKDEDVKGMSSYYMEHQQQLYIAAVIEGSTIAKRSATNRYPIVDILCLMSVEIVFNRLSNVYVYWEWILVHRPALVYGYTDSLY